MLRSFINQNNVTLAIMQCTQWKRFTYRDQAGAIGIISLRDKDFNTRLSINIANTNHERYVFEKNGLEFIDYQGRS